MPYKRLTCKMRKDQKMIPGIDFSLCIILVNIVIILKPGTRLVSQSSATFIFHILLLLPTLCHLFIAEKYEKGQGVVYCFWCHFLLFTFVPFLWLLIFKMFFICFLMLSLWWDSPGFTQLVWFNLDIFLACLKWMRQVLMAISLMYCKPKIKNN